MTEQIITDMIFKIILKLHFTFEMTRADFFQVLQNFRHLDRASVRYSLFSVDKMNNGNQHFVLS